MIRSLVLVAIATVYVQSSFAYDQKHFQVSEVIIQDITDSVPAHLEPYAAGNGGWSDQCSSDEAVFVPKLSGDGSTIGEKIGKEINPIDVIDVWVDKIINLGKKIFAVIDKGRPVVNIKTDVANALPAGVRCWTDLAGWNIPASKVFHVTYKNVYGVSVVDYSYRITYTAGGNLNGIGKYLTNVTVQPANVSVAWGFNLDAKAVIASVFNVGEDRRNPIAAMQMDIEWTVKTPLQHNQMTRTYYIDGNNQVLELE